MSMRRSVTIHARQWDAGTAHATAQDALAALLAAARQSLESGADIVLFPEYALLNAAPHGDDFDPEEFADSFWADLWPVVTRNVQPAAHQAVILGSVPARTARGLVNRCPVFANGAWIFQDKLCLTPWEKDLVAGETLHIVDLNGVRFAVLICLDIEILSIAQKLKEDGSVDLILVPSATETRAGVERIARCAYARAVELGCATVTTSLTGSQGDDSFVGSCQGRTGMYMPAQSVTYHLPRYAESDVVTQGNGLHVYEIDMNLIRQVKDLTHETNPARLDATQEIVIRKS